MIRCVDKASLGIVEDALAMLSARKRAEFLAPVDKAFDSGAAALDGFRAIIADSQSGQVRPACSKKSTSPAGVVKVKSALCFVSQINCDFAKMPPPRPLQRRIRMSDFA